MPFSGYKVVTSTFSSRIEELKFQKVDVEFYRSKAPKLIRILSFYCVTIIGIIYSNIALEINKANFIEY